MKLRWGKTAQGVVVPDVPGSLESLGDIRSHTRDVPTTRIDEHAWCGRSLMVARRE